MSKKLLVPFIICSVLAFGTAAQAAPSNPIPPALRSAFACIIWHESRSTFAHPNLGDNNADGSSGVFQIEQATWVAHQHVAGVPYSVHVWQATFLQQEKVAVAIQRADGWGPWSADYVWCSALMH